MFLDIAFWSQIHCVESVQIRSFFWSVFPCIRTKYRDLQSKYAYSVRIQENTDQKKLRIWTLHAVINVNFSNKNNRRKLFLQPKYFSIGVAGMAPRSIFQNFFETFLKPEIQHKR